MRPMSLYESGLSSGEIGMRELFAARTDSAAGAEAARQGRSADGAGDGELDDAVVVVAQNFSQDVVVVLAQAGA